jgi:MoaA/NifB/PqqE/SkfB family radical SAM enzyme
MLSKITVPILEYHLTNSCNLSCESCSHYTNVLKGNFKEPQDLEKNLSAWSKIISIDRFDILGGEPFLNKHIDNFCTIARRVLPSSSISVITNGLLLDKIKNIDQILQTLIENDITITVSMHSTKKEYLDSFKNNLNLLNNWKNLGLNIKIYESVTNWTKRYHTNTDGMISPFQDNNSEESWNICPCKYHTMLIEDKIYKCAPLAYLKHMKEIEKITPEFDPYLKYQPISHTQPLEEIELFFEKNYKPESWCGMCPAKTIYIRNKKI